MDTIICLVGESGSGKSTIALELEKIGCNYIKSYTTRPKRSDNEDGHIFVDKDYISKFKKQDIIAYTEFDGHAYWSARSQYKNKGISVYVIEPLGAAEFKSIVLDSRVIIIYLKTDSKTRFHRMVKDRGTKMAERRLSYDESSGRFDVIKCDYIINAQKDTDFVVNEIIKIAKNKMKCK
ncbi:MAG: AAA family ATPase [Clostridium sp.]|nr:AAA family ATPase [Clostridium sp.]